MVYERVWVVRQEVWVRNKQFCYKNTSFDKEGMMKALSGNTKLHWEGGKGARCHLFQNKFQVLGQICVILGLLFGSFF